MTVEWLKLCDTKLIDDQAKAFVVAGSDRKTYIRNITLHNTHSSALVVTLYRVPDASNQVGIAAAANQVLYNSLAAYETVVIELLEPGWVLSDEGDSLQALCGTADKVTISVDGGKE